MTVEKDPSWFEDLGNGITTAFLFDNVVLPENVIQVDLVNVSSGVITPQVEGVDYTLTRAPDFTTATIEFAGLGGAPTAQQYVRRYRNDEFTQPAEYEEGDEFPAKTHEKALDRNCILTQQARDDRDRTVGALRSERVLDRIPVVGERAGRVAGYDGDGNPIVAATSTAELDALSGSFSVPDFTFTNVATMKAAANLTPGKTARTLGYYTAGDGGAAYYQAVAGGTGTDDGGEYHDLNNGNQAFLITPRDVVNAKIWGAFGDGSTDDTPYITAALNKISADGGGVLYLPAGVYRIVSKVNRTISNITIYGDGMPWYNAGNTALEGAGKTIIQGQFQLNGDNIMIRSLGVDCGLDVCNDINAGAFMDALVILDPARSILFNITVKDVVTLCRDQTAACHNYLFEGLSGCHFSNLHARFAQWGVVLKTQKTTADGLHAYACDQAGFTLKSDTGVGGSPCNTTTVTNVFVDNDDHPTAFQGILLFAASEDLFSCSLSNFYTKNGAVGLKVLCDTRAAPTNLLNNVAVSNGVIEFASTFGIECFGAMSDVAMTNIVVQQTQSNNSIKVWSDCLGISMNNIFASALNTAQATNVDLAGRFSFNDLHSIVGEDMTAPSGINVVPDDRTTMSIGNYRGTLYLSGVLSDITLTNGWTSFFSTVTIDAKSNKAILQGRVQVPSLPWTGKEQIGTIPANIAPFNGKFFMGNAFDGSSNATVPVLVEVTQAGAINATYLNTVAAFPATILWVSIDGLSWSLNEQ